MQSKGNKYFSVFRYSKHRIDNDMKNLIYDCFKYSVKYKISIAVIVIFCFDIVLFDYQFKLVLEPIYGQAMNYFI